MIIRDTTQDDVDDLKRLMKNQSFDYPELPFNSFVECLSIEQDGKVILTVAARPTVELYYLGDPEWETPGMRAEVLKKMHSEMEKRLASRGYTDAHAWIPPIIAKSFGRRLRKTFKMLNGSPKWIQSTWTCFTAFIERSHNV